MKRKSPSKSKKLSAQVREHSQKSVDKAQEEYDGDTTQIISTGSTLLDLAISGGRIDGGGIPGGILVEIFGPSGSGKTVMLCEIAGAVQRQGGQIMFHDPEARLNKQFAKLFDLEIAKEDYTTPDTVPEVFKPIRKWEPEPEEGVIHGIFADSLAALSTKLEMDNDEGDKMGMKRAKEFSEECRKTCRILTQRNFLMVASNQIRQNLDAGYYGPKYKAPGGEAIGFYASLRLRCGNPTKIKRKVTVAGKELEKVVGVETEIEVFKSTVWEPFHTAPIHILFDYGIDDIRANLRFLKRMTKDTSFVVAGERLGKSMEEAISAVEERGLESKLRTETIGIWAEIEERFRIDRKPKRR